MHVASILTPCISAIMPYTVHDERGCQHDIFFQRVVPYHIGPMEANNDEAIIGYYAIVGE